MAIGKRFSIRPTIPLLKAMWPEPNCGADLRLSAGGVPRTVNPSCFSPMLNMLKISSGMFSSQSGENLKRWL